MIEELNRRKQACIRLYDHAIESLRTLGSLPYGDNAAHTPAMESSVMLSDESKRVVVERQKARWAEWKRSEDN